MINMCKVENSVEEVDERKTRSESKNDGYVNSVSIKNIKEYIE